jgi:hypothetical protein
VVATPAPARSYLTLEGASAYSADNPEGFLPPPSYFFPTRRGRFNLLADETRLRLLLLLLAAGDEDVAVGDLVESLGMSQPALRHHLQQLRLAGAVSCRHEGVVGRLVPPVGVGERPGVGRVGKKRE